MQPNQEVQPKLHHNLIVRIGMWLTVISAAIWAGGYLIKTIQFALPYALGTGILVMMVGMFIEFRKRKRLPPSQ